MGTLAAKSFLLILCSLAFCACTTISERQLVATFGEPELVCEHAGDLGRYRTYRFTPKYVWQIHSTEFIYLERNVIFTVEDGVVTDASSIEEDERSYYIEILADVD